eukprot:TRINITY_DN8279_c0_g4_i1.p1 TRINITY_DN8279_c0_g4~~TRINITY_DN8279_c0_g4_i1.p1  ORF type:complete len:517 (+),score=146.76 TRINITY_DN8279_c0_g4_i1:36-1586(+)
MAAVTDGLGIDSRAVDAVLTVPVLKNLARFCERLIEAEKPKKEVIEGLRDMAENVGEVETVAGAITRHIKFAKGSKQLLCWYLLDILAKKHPDSFGHVFGPQILELAVHHMNWVEPKEEAKYARLVDTWRVLFGYSTCEEIMNKKEVIKAEHIESERLKADRITRGEPEEAPKGPKWDSRELVVGGVKDGQLIEHVESCKWYLVGLCENPNCPRPHPPGLFGSRSTKKVLGDWNCLRCGYKNPGSKKQCWRRDCNGVKPELLISIQNMMAENPFAKQFGYDPDNEEEAVAHFKDTNWDEWKAERKRKYPIIWAEWSKRRPAVSSSAAYSQAVGRPCQSCFAPLRPGAAFCGQCGQKQFTAPPAQEMQERDDLLFPSTRLALPDAPCTVSGIVSTLLRVCRDVLSAPDHTAYLAEFQRSIQAAAHDPTYQQLPDSRSIIILRALSHIYSKWSWQKLPSDPTPSFLVNIAAMRTILPLKDIDQEVFDRIASEAYAAQQGAPSGPAPVGPMPQSGTVSL